MGIRADTMLKSLSVSPKLKKLEIYQGFLQKIPCRPVKPLQYFPPLSLPPRKSRIPPCLSLKISMSSPKSPWLLPFRPATAHFHPERALCCQYSPVLPPLLARYRCANFDWWPGFVSSRTNRVSCGMSSSRLCRFLIWILPDFKGWDFFVYLQSYAFSFFTFFAATMKKKWKKKNICVSVLIHLPRNFCYFL